MGYKTAGFGHKSARRFCYTKLCLENNTERRVNVYAKRKVMVQGNVIPLTVKEFEIFSLLILNPKRVFTYEMLMDLVWKEDYTYYSRKAVNNHVSNLRRKLRVSPDLPDYVKSVYGIGYKFEEK